jgi:hypothetical protein
MRTGETRLSIASPEIGWLLGAPIRRASSAGDARSMARGQHLASVPPRSCPSPIDAKRPDCALRNSSGPWQQTPGHAATTSLDEDSPDHRG